MKTKLVSALTKADFPAVHIVIAGGMATLYYHGDELPVYPVPTPEQIAAAAAAEQKETDELTAARGDAKLRALSDMSPAEVRTWINDNTPNLAAAKDHLATLAVAVGQLARRL